MQAHQQEEEEEEGEEEEEKVEMGTGLGPALPPAADSPLSRVGWVVWWDGNNACTGFPPRPKYQHCQSLWERPMPCKLNDAWPGKPGASAVILGLVSGH